MIPSHERRLEAVYLGVENYGSAEVNKDTIRDFRYRFLAEGREISLRIDPGTRKENGRYEYPIQNRLKEQYRYEIILEGETVAAAEELREEEKPVFVPAEEDDRQSPENRDGTRRNNAVYLRRRMELAG